jgi:hypothetical protein
MTSRVIRPLAILLPLIVFLLNYGLFQEPVNQVIERDQRNHGMVVRAHWRWYVDPTVLVYDLRETSGDATGVDLLRAFLQFAYRQKDRHFGRVDLAWRGATRFVITGGDFADLGRQYATRSPMDTVTVVPALLFRPDGTRAFPARVGSFVAQNQQRILDFNAFVNAWVSR